jgi:hypothetical protein
VARRRTHNRIGAAARADLRWAFRADDTEILAALAHGRHRRGLAEYFGAEMHAELSALARRAGARDRHTPRSVLIVPGMMGSRLAGARGAVIWIDPEHIAAGALVRLTLPAGRSPRPRGVLLHGYARLYLTLRIEGFRPEFFAYDWRLGLETLGARLAAYLRRPGAPSLLIAHSMGGLVARSAVAQLPPGRLERLIMLGTPHTGCFDPVLALRGTHPFVRSLARIDRRHSAAWLAAHVFNTFPGLYDLLPERRGAAPDLLRPGGWPREGPQPIRELLAGARRARDALAPADERMVHVVGTGEPTIETVRPGPGGLAYFTSTRGDGTVPVARTRLRGLKTLYVAAAHGALLRHPQVIAALLDLLRRGMTRRLSRRPSAPKGRARSPGRRSRTDDARLGAGEESKIEWRRLDGAQRAALLEQLDGLPRRGTSRAAARRPRKASARP